MAYAATGDRLPVLNTVDAAGSASLVRSGGADLAARQRGILDFAWGEYSGTDLVVARGTAAVGHTLGCSRAGRPD